MSGDWDAFRWVDPEEIREIVRGKERGEVVIERRYQLLAEFQGVLIVLYFFALTFLMSYNTSFFGLPPIIVRSLVLPILLSLPWLIIYYVGMEKWALTFKLLDTLMNRVSYFQKFFYLINALFLYLIIIIPVLTPVLSIFSLLYLAYIVVRGVGSRRLRYLLAILISIGYSLLIYQFLDIILSVYFHFVLDSLIPFTADYWFNHLLIIYVVSLAVASSSSLGSFIKFIYEGAQQVDSSVVIPIKKIYVVQFLYIALTLFPFFYFNYDVRMILTGFLLLSIVESLLRRLKGLTGEQTELESWFGFVGWAIYIIFLMIEFLRNMLPFNPLLQVVPISIAGALFILMFMYTYKKASLIMGALLEK